MGAGLRPGTKAPESPPDPNVGAPAPDSTSSSGSEIFLNQLEHSVRHGRGAQGESVESELMTRLEQEMRRFLYRFYSPKPDETPRSGLVKTCRRGRLMQGQFFLAGS